MNSVQKELDVDLSKCASLGNELLEIIDTIREAKPIYWSETNQCWIITGHAEVLEAFRGTLPFSNRRAHRAFQIVPPEGRAARIPYLLETLPHWIIDMDPPDQPRLRRLMMKAFRREIAEDLRPAAKQIIKEALDDAGNQGTVEFISTVARRIPSRVILKLMGLPDDLEGPLRNWTDAISNALGGFAQSIELLEACERALIEMRDIFLPEIEKRRKEPTNDFISGLVTARDQDNRLSEEEMVGICHLTLLAGNDSTGGTIGLGAAALATHPEACEYIRANPGKVSDVIMELQRYVSMSAMQPRTIGADFTWRGHDFKKDQFAMLMIAGANRDPRAFRNPRELDFTQPQNVNMTFAPGLHFCIGHYIARMQLAEFFPELLRRFDLELLDDRLDFQPALAFRGLNTLNLRLSPRS
jgi:cytochrome P450